MAGAPKSLATGLETFIDVDMKAAGDVVELSASLTSTPVTASFRSYTVPDAAYAPAHLVTDGKRWIERDGPTFVFASLGTQGGLDWFFPDLPDAIAGAETAWSVQGVDPANVLATEIARGHHPQLAQQHAESSGERPQAVVARVRFVRWLDEGGARVAELAMTASQDVSAKDSGAGAMADMSMQVRGSSETKGAYFVLASGRLLRAHVTTDGTIDMTTVINGKKDVQHHTRRTVREMHLVKACDGPTATPLAKPLTRVERAIHDWGDASIAFATDDLAKMLAAFDASLRRKHGDARITAALRELRTLRGERVIEPPVLLDEKDANEDGGDVMVRSRGSVRDPTTPHTVTPVEVSVTLHEVDGRFVVTRMTGDLVVATGNLFLISADALAVRHGWPPR